MAAGTFPVSLQESVLTTLAFDKQHGAMIAIQVTVELFDEPYREIVRRILDYRRDYGKPPGEAHLDDQLAPLLESSARRAPQTRRIVEGMFRQREGLNAAYIASLVQKFIRAQTLKQAILTASERYSQGGEDQLEDVEEVLYKALRLNTTPLDPGIFLSDTKRGLAFLDLQDGVMSLGIPMLNKMGVGPTPKELLLYIAPKGTGKTWFGVNAGRQALMQNERVMHITAETSQERVSGRYYQALFAAATRPEQGEQTALVFDSLGRFQDFRKDYIKPKLDLTEPGSRKKLRQNIEEWGERFSHLVVKEFPSASLTVSQLVSYMDYMEHSAKFIPTLLILDSPDNFKIPTNDFRLATRRMFEDIRGLASSRNLAVVATTQGNRSSLNAKTVRSDMVAEDISKVQTADNTLTFSATELEKEMGVGRLHVAHARNVEGGVKLIITQSYKTGQYCVQSAPLDEMYFKKLKELGGNADDEDEDK